MKIIKRLGLVAVMAGLLTLAIVLNLGGGVSSATTPPDPTSCYCTMPALSLVQSNAYWADMTAYTNRTLSVDFEVHNNSANMANAKNMHVVGTTNSSGVISTDHGRNINMVAVDECELFTMEYYVPMGVAAFTTQVHAETEDQCGNSYSYGGPPSP